MGILDLQYLYHKLTQLLLHSKVAKAEKYLIGGYHTEWLELTYYIETLGLGLIFQDTKNICCIFHREAGRSRELFVK